MLSKFSVKRPYTVIVGVVIVLILGIVSFMGMQVDLLPSINLPYSVVVTSYTGASPEEVETVVSKPLEQSMATVSNIKNVMSVSSENISMVVLEFNQDTDMTAAANEMREKIDLVTPYWDDDNIGAPMIMQLNPDMVPVVVASIDMEEKDAGELSAFVDESVLPRLESVEGVASVNTFGMAENRINVTIDDELIDDINEAIGASIDGDINKAKAMLGAARSQIQAGYSALNSAKAEGEAKLDEAQKQLDEGKATLEGSLPELEKAVAALEQQKNSVDSELSALKNEKASAEAEAKKYSDADEAIPGELTAKIQSLDAQISEKEKELSGIEAQLSEAKQGLESAQAQLTLLEGQQSEVDKGRAELNDQLGSAKSQLDSGLSQVNAQSSKLSSAAATAKKNADIKEYITKEMISGILMAQNFDMPAGTFDAKEGSYSVKVGKSLSSLADVENLLLFELNMAGVDDIRVKDVARVATAGVDDASYTKINGNPGILLSFEKQSNYSTAEVSENIQSVMTDLGDEYEGFSYRPFMDQGEYVHIIIDSIIDNLLLGAILAIVILIICLKDIRPTAIVAVSIPASLLFALVMMYFTGVTMNLISMSGLALGVGMLVDNSIVVIENTYRLRKEGVPAMDAAIDGAKQVAGAIVASTLTTICVFIPIAFTDGMSKDLFKDMGLTIGYSLVASLIVALTVVPSMASRVLKKDSDKDSSLFAFLKEKYDKSIRWILGHRKLTIWAICLLLVVSTVLSLSRGFSFMPEYDSTELTATLTTEDEDMSEAAFYSVADDIMAAALKNDGVDSIAGMGGSTAAMSMMSSGGDDRNVSMYILLDEKHPAKSKELERQLQKVAESKNCEISLSSGMDMMSYLGGSGITLTVKGEDLSELSSFTKQLGEDIAEVEGIEEVTSDMESPSQQLMVTVDKDKAMKEGLTVAQVFQAIAGDIAGDKAATTMTVDGTEYSVFVIDPGDKERSIDEISDIEVEGEKGKAKVGDIADVGVENSPSSVYRQNQQRYMTVSATVCDDAVTSKVTDHVEKLVNRYDMPSGITVEVGGESVTVGEYMTDLVKAILLALVLMYLIMVAQFQSLRSPFIVMFTVPLAFTGGFLALFLCGFDVSVIALLGFLVLSGVVVNNGIVLVDYVNQLVEGGMEVKEALVLGGKTRLRPILMTAMTTILAMLTMALGIGDGTEMVQPMAIVSIGGLLYATIMTLYFVPVMYDLMHGKGREKKVKRPGKGKHSPLTETIDGETKEGDEPNDAGIF